MFSTRRCCQGLSAEKQRWEEAHVDVMSLNVSSDTTTIYITNTSSTIQVFQWPLYLQCHTVSTVLHHGLVIQNDRTYTGVWLKHEIISVWKYYLIMLFDMKLDSHNDQMKENLVSLVCNTFYWISSTGSPTIANKSDQAEDGEHLTLVGLMWSMI